MKKQVFLILLTAIFAVLLLQSQNVGFEKGHLGWVATHSLAVAEHATFNNGFLGYALQRIDGAGQRDMHYFDRYPVFFSGFSYFFLRVFGDDLISHIYLSRTLMNIVFILTLIVGYFLALELARSFFQTSPSSFTPPENQHAIALAATLFTFSGSLLLFYKEMYHFDQPALLGQGLLLLGIARFMRQSLSKKFFFLIVAASVLIGRGYANCFVLLLWFFLDLFMRRKERRGKFLSFVKDVPFQAFLLAVLLSIASLAYNIGFEAEVRQISLEQTSIVESATRRLGLNEKFDQEMKDSISWKTAIGRLFNRTLYGLVPFGAKPTNPQSIGAPGIIYLLILIFTFAWAVSKWRREKQNNPPDRNTRTFFFLLMGSGALWLLTMKRLFVFHDYTTLYMTFFSLGFYVFLIQSLTARTQRLLPLGALFIFIFSLVLAKIRIEQTRDATEPLTYDFAAIEAQVNGIETVSVDGEIYGFFPEMPYALGFFLHKQWLAPLSISPYIVTRDRNYEGENLTPENTKVFLFREKKKL